VGLTQARASMDRLEYAHTDSLKQTTVHGKVMAALAVGVHFKPAAAAP